MATHVERDDAMVCGEPLVCAVPARVAGHAQAVEQYDGRTSVVLRGVAYRYLCAGDVDVALRRHPRRLDVWFVCCGHLRGSLSRSLEQAQPTRCFVCRIRAPSF